MKRRIVSVISILAIAAAIWNLAYVVKDSFFYSVDRLPEGTFVRVDYDQNILFSTGYYLKVYQVEKTSRYPAAVRVEACNDSTGMKKTIYWQIGTESSVISWLEEFPTVVSVNGISIDFTETVYDCRDYENFVYTDTTIKQPRA